MNRGGYGWVSRSFEWVLGSYVLLRYKCKAMYENVTPDLYDLVHVFFS